jgi:XTP/dITP diphosphohydrolase
MRKIVIASYNAGKLRELSALLKPLGIEAVAQATLGVGEAEEPHGTFLENALAKARHASAMTGLPARNNARLVADLANVEDLSAFYYCVLVLVTSPIDPTPIVVDGTWHGTIVTTPRGNGGFGYDPYFQTEQMGLTAAELEADDKNRLSHRGKALARLASRLTAQRNL